MGYWIDLPYLGDLHILHEIRRLEVVRCWPNSTSDPKILPCLLHKARVVIGCIVELSIMLMGWRLNEESSSILGNLCCRLRVLIWGRLNHVEMIVM
jgi:hypothetical protein